MCRYFVGLLLLLVLGISACSTSRELSAWSDPDHRYGAILEMIDCSRALVSTDEEFIGKHIAALKWFDANVILSGQSESYIRPFLEKTVVQSVTHASTALDLHGTSAPECVLYKFPLYGCSSENALTDEPNTNYDFYAVWIDKTKLTVYKTAFIYRGTVKYRPAYDSFTFSIHTDQKAYGEVNSDDAAIRTEAISKLGSDRSSRAVTILHNKLKQNILSGKGHHSSRSIVATDFGTASIRHASENELLIKALVKQEAQEAVPTLRGLLEKPEECRGISLNNLLYSIYAITDEPVTFEEEGKSRIYKPRESFNEKITRIR